MGWIGKRLIFLSCLFLLAGCWDFERLRDRVLITGIAIDKQGEGYQIGLEIIEFRGQSQDQGSVGKPSFMMTSFPERSIELPLHLIQRRLSGEPFYPNIRILVFGKEQAMLAYSHVVRRRGKAP